MTTSMLQHYIHVMEDEIDEFIHAIDQSSIESAKKLILKSASNHGRVHVTGIGKPSHVARYFSALLSSTGTKSYHLDATEAVHGSAGQVAKGDVVIAISNSGETTELQSAIMTLKQNGAIIIGVSGGKKSWLAQASDAFLYAGVHQEGDTLNKPPRMSILAEIIILQCLSVALQEAYSLSIEEYYDWHPGGALGASIRKLKEDGNED